MAWERGPNMVKERHLSAESPVWWAQLLSTEGANPNEVFIENDRNEKTASKSRQFNWGLAVINGAFVWPAVGRVEREEQLLLIRGAKKGTQKREGVPLQGRGRGKERGSRKKGRDCY